MFVILGAASVLGLLVHWGGTARPGSSFVLGVSVFIALQLGFGAFTYWLLFAPMRGAARTSSMDSAWVRQLAAVGVLAGGFLFGFAATWDEAWHRAYGGFGRDFWWMPHLLLYGSFALVSLMAASSLVWVSARSTGGLRERARGETLIALLALIGGFLAVSAPSDELWHRIYGLDLTAWSLPHTTVVFSYCALMLCGVSLALSGAPRDDARRSWLEARVGEWLALLLLVAISLQGLQFATTEWEGMQTAQNLSRALSLRPEWLFPVVVVSLGALVGAFSSAALRLPGTATLVAALTLAERAVSLLAFNGFQNGMTMRAYLLFAVVMVALEVWAWRQRKSARFDWSAFLMGSLLALAVMLVFIPSLMPYPRVDLSTAPWMMVFGSLTSLGFGWVGWRLGSAVHHLERRVAPTGARLGRFTTVALGGVAVIVVLAVSGARPPL
jgi:hypothetical protein